MKFRILLGLPRVIILFRGFLFQIIAYYTSKPDSNYLGPLPLEGLPNPWRGGYGSLLRASALPAAAHVGCLSRGDGRLGRNS